MQFAHEEVNETLLAWLPVSIRTAWILSGPIPYNKIYFRFESFNQSDSCFVRELILFYWINFEIDSYILFLITNILVLTNIFYLLTLHLLKYPRNLGPFLVLRNRSYYTVANFTLLDSISFKIAYTLYSGATTYISSPLPTAPQI